MAEMREQPWSVLVVQPQKQFGETFIGLLQQQSVVALVVAAAGILLSLWRAHTVVKPLLSLTSASRKLAKGDFTARAFVTSKDEVGQLADTFNHMVPQLEQRVELQKSVELAHKIQQSLLPQQPPHDKGVEIAGKSHYCDATGGDYFDFAEAVDLPSGSST
ncbi:MAG: HAMP domain-containing protein [Nibricoccus sp.]